MTSDQATEAILGIIREVAEGKKEDFFYPMGAPSLRLVMRVQDVLSAQCIAMREALKPFAEAGALFLPADASDRSCYVTESDDAPIGNRLVWRTTPLTIGHLRAARRAL